MFFPSFPKPCSPYASASCEQQTSQSISHITKKQHSYSEYDQCLCPPISHRKKKNRTKQKKLAPQRGTNRRRIPYRYSWINLLLSVWAKAKAPTEDMKQIYILFINNRKTDVEYRKTNEKKQTKQKQINNKIWYLLTWKMSYGAAAVQHTQHTHTPPTDNTNAAQHKHDYRHHACDINKYM